jgi:hypothetical protein
MEYVLLLHEDETRWNRMTEEEAGREMGAYVAYTNALRESGAFREGNPLKPTPTATLVRVTADGKTSVLDGPYAETKEQLGGYYVIDVPDLDAAISWAARCPCASGGTVEVRPVMPMPMPA